MTEQPRQLPELEELRESVAALRSELVSRFGAGFRSVPSLPAVQRWTQGVTRTLLGSLEELGAGPLLKELRRLQSFLARDVPSLEVDGFGFDPLFLDQNRFMLDFLYERWWRVQVSGTERLPPEGRLLFVANRSGVLPYDGIMIAHAVEREHPSGKRPRFLAADWLATAPFLQSLLPRLGGVRACPENAERLLLRGDWVVAFPEGRKGALKLFGDRYQLQRFARGGFVSLALRLNAVVVPVAVVGAEEVHPVLLRSGFVDRWLGFPLPVTPTFPMLGPVGLLPLPSQWRIVFGEPIRWDGVDPERADDALYVNRMRDRIRTTIATLLDEQVHLRTGVFG